MEGPAKDPAPVGRHLANMPGIAPANSEGVRLERRPTDTLGIVPGSLNGNLDKHSTKMATKQTDANTQVYVIILRCDARSNEAHVDNLKALFSNPAFIIEVLEVLPPSGASKPTSTMSTQNLIELHCVTEALMTAATRHPELPVVVIKDSSISVASPDVIARNVLKPIQQNVDFDIYYLCKWMDECQKYSNVNIAEETISGPRLVWTQSPNGIQALLFTVNGREVVLGRRPMRNGQTFKVDKPLSSALRDQIANGAIKALSIFPNLVEFDISLATSNADYLRTSQCRPVVNNGPMVTNSPAGIVWFTLIVLLVLLIAWAMIRAGPRR
jgi:hypothetical protein